VSRHGKITWYFRRGDGPRIRLRGEYESPEWLADYDATLGGTKVIEPVRSQAGTLRWLVDRYYDSAAWAKLSDATKRQRKSIFTRMLATGGDLALAKITKRTILDGRDRRAETPAAAVCFVKDVRAMFKWAVEAELSATNPAVGIVANDPDTDGHHTWSIEEVRMFEARHPTGTMARLALDLMLYTGMRRSDAVLFGRQHVRGDILEYRSLKTGIEVVAPS
jgi:integrase